MTISLLTFLIGLSSLAGSDSYQRALAANDAERIAGALRHARSLAQANSCRVPPCSEQKTKSVRIAEQEVVVYEGTLFDDSDTLLRIPLSKAFTTEPTDVVFMPRSGYVLEEKAIRMTDTYGRKRVIRVNKAGMVALELL